ncbi:MAG: chloride channel protein [Ilumatobacteraceae bacterium]
MRSFVRIPAHRRHELRHLVTRSQRVMVMAGLVGVVTGAFVALFDSLIANVMVDHLGGLPPWALAFVPGVGLVVARAARQLISPGTSAATADEYIEAFHERSHPLRWRPFAARTVGAVATLGSGAPMGLEGMSVYAGATIGSNIQRRFPRLFRNADHRLLMVAGAAAGVAAIFKAPATGAVFAMEVPYQDDLARRMLLPALVAAATGYLTFVAVHGTVPLFAIDAASAFSIRDLLGAVAVGVLAGLCARVFAKMLRTAKLVAVGDHPWLATVGAGIVLAAMFGLGRALTGESLMIGPGYHVVEWAAQPGHSIPVLLGILALRCMATSVAVAGGGVGGLFIPLVVAGALTGAVIGTAVNRFDLTLFIVIGVAAFLGAGYRVPLAAVMFVAETTGRPSFIVPGLLAAVAAELVMGSSSVTAYQRRTDHAATTTTHVPT